MADPYVIPQDELQTQLVTYLNAALKQFKSKPFDQSRAMDNQRMSAVTSVSDDVKNPLRAYMKEMQTQVVDAIRKNENLHPPMNENKIDAIRKFLIDLSASFKDRLEDPKIWQDLGLSDQAKEKMKDEILSAFVFITLYDARGKVFGNTGEKQSYNAVTNIINLRSSILANINQPNDKLVEAVMYNRAEKDVRNSLAGGIAGLRRIFTSNNQAAREVAINEAFGTWKPSDFKEDNEFTNLGILAQRRVIEEIETTIKKIEASDWKKTDKAHLINLIVNKAQTELNLAIPGRTAKTTPLKSPEITTPEITTNQVETQTTAAANQTKNTAQRETSAKTLLVSTTNKIFQKFDTLKSAVLKSKVPTAEQQNTTPETSSSVNIASDTQSSKLNTDPKQESENRVMRSRSSPHNIAAYRGADADKETAENEKPRARTVGSRERSGPLVKPAFDTREKVEAKLQQQRGGIILAEKPAHDQLTTPTNAHEESKPTIRRRNS